MENGKFIDGLYHYDEQPRIRLPVVCSRYVRRKCRSCGEAPYHKYIELKGIGRPIRIWICCSCGAATRARKRPSG